LRFTLYGYWLNPYLFFNTFISYYVHTHNTQVIFLVNMTLSIPKELKDQMDLFPEINWSEVARSAIREKVADLTLLKEFTSKSKLTEEDAIELGRKVNKALAKRYRRSA